MTLGNMVMMSMWNGKSCVGRVSPAPVKSVNLLNARRMMMKMMTMMMMKMMTMVMILWTAMTMTRTAATRSASPPASLKYCAVEWEAWILDKIISIFFFIMSKCLPE